MKVKRKILSQKKNDSLLITNNIDRLDLINARLQEIGNGNHLKIITEADERERPKKTTCIGINWDYEFQDIIEIAEVYTITLRFQSSLVFI
jgi:hypothetical protein